MNNPPKKHQKKNKPSGTSGFFAFAIFVFTALAVGLVVILMRSQA